MAQHVGMSTTTTGNYLDRLVSLNLLDIRITDEVRYTFSPGTPELADISARFEDAYRQRPMLVIRYVTEHATSKATDFADAFRFRPNEPR